MKIEKVTYQKVFPLSPFVNEKVGIEIQLDAGEVAEDVLCIAKATVEGWHKAQNPGIYMDTQDAVVNLQDEVKQITIDNAATIEELAALKRGLPSHMMPAYMTKLKVLTHKLKV